jgi:hypothetical protein
MTKKKSKYKIHDWQKINLMKEDAVNCCKQGCKKPALWFYDDNGKQKCYCGIHKGSCKNIIYPSKKQHTKKITCQKVFKQKAKECNSKITWTLRNNDGELNHYCNKHKPIDCPIIKVIKKQGANKMPIDILQKRLLQKLEEMHTLLEADIVVIENQPSLKNPRMKAIASTLYNFYLIRSTIDKDIVDTNIKSVVFMCPSNKLKLDENNAIVLAKTTKKNKYKITKELAIKYCKKLLEDDEENLEFLESTDKKDDLCDCFLQGCYYLTHKM